MEKRCWREAGCMYNSNNPSAYMQCKREDMSIEECARVSQIVLKDNIRTAALKVLASLTDPDARATYSQIKNQCQVILHLNEKVKETITEKEKA